MAGTLQACQDAVRACNADKADIVKWSQTRVGTTERKETLPTATASKPATPSIFERFRSFIFGG